MKRMEVRCCCTPNKLLGTLPVPDAAGPGARIVYQVMKPRVRVPDPGAAPEGRRPPQIAFEVTRWAERRFGRDGCVNSTEGVALKHENVTLETLRLIPGFIEAKPVDDAALLKRALEALEYHREQTRPIEWTDAAIAALRARLGDNNG